MKKLASSLADNPSMISHLLSISAVSEEQALRLMRKEPAMRSGLDLACLSKYLLRIAFFQKLQKEADDMTVKECAKCVFTQTHSAGEVTAT
jgi:hypothetical protein